MPAVGTILSGRTDEPFFLIVHAFVYGSILILLKVNTFVAENKYVSFVFSLSFWPNKRPLKTAKILQMMNSAVEYLMWAY